ALGRGLRSRLTTKRPTLSMGGPRTPNDLSDAKKLLSGPRERCATGIDWASDVRIVVVPRIDVNMEMGERVPVEFVVHLDGREEVCKAFCHEHHVVPKGAARGRGQFEWFYHVSLRDDRDVTGERGPTRGGNPRRREGRDTMPRVPASTDRASLATSAKGPCLRGLPQRPSDWFGHLSPRIASRERSRPSQAARPRRESRCT